MKRNSTVVFFALFFLVFDSCVVVRSYNRPPDEVVYEASSESGQVYSNAHLRFNEDRYNRLSRYFQSVFPLRYENYSIEMSFRNLTENFNNDKDTMLYMYIDVCRIVLPSGNVIDLLDNNIAINYIYIGPDLSQRAPPKMLRDVQPQHTDGRKVLYLDSIVDRDGVRIQFNAKIPSFANSLRLEYALTVVWENQGEVKIRKNLLFKKIFEKYYVYSV